MNETQLLRSRVQDLLHLLSFAKIETPTPGDLPEAEKAMADIRGMLSHPTAAEQPRAPEQGAVEVVAYMTTCADGQIISRPKGKYPHDEWVSNGWEPLVKASHFVDINKMVCGAPKLEPMTDEQIEPMFRNRHAVPTVGEKDAWYWYAWGVSDGEAHHGISTKGACE